VNFTKVRALEKDEGRDIIFDYIRPKNKRKMRINLIIILKEAKEK